MSLPKTTLAILLVSAAGCNRGDKAASASAGRVSVTQSAASSNPPVAARPVAADPVAAPQPNGLPPPELKTGDLASTIKDPRTIADPRIADVYEKVKSVAERLDRMYCYCHCHEAMGHRSLLTCFQGDHAAECGICLREGYQAWVDWKQGRPVEATQRTADAIYNGSNPPPSLPPAR